MAQFISDRVGDASDPINQKRLSDAILTCARRDTDWLSMSQTAGIFGGGGGRGSLMSEGMMKGRNGKYIPARVPPRAPVISPVGFSSGRGATLRWHIETPFLAGPNPGGIGGDLTESVVSDAYGHADFQVGVCNLASMELADPDQSHFTGIDHHMRQFKKYSELVVKFVDQTVWAAVTSVQGVNPDSNSCLINPTTGKFETSNFRNRQLIDKPKRINFPGNINDVDDIVDGTTLSATLIRDVKDNIAGQTQERKIFPLKPVPVSVGAYTSMSDRGLKMREEWKGDGTDGAFVVLMHPKQWNQIVKESGATDGSYTSMTQRLTEAKGEMSPFFDGAIRNIAGCVIKLSNGVPIGQNSNGITYALAPILGQAGVLAAVMSSRESKFSNLTRMQKHYGLAFKTDIQTDKLGWGKIQIARMIFEAGRHRCTHPSDPNIRDDKSNLHDYGIEFLGSHCDLPPAVGKYS